MAFISLLNFFKRRALLVTTLLKFSIFECFFFPFGLNFSIKFL